VELRPLPVSIGAWGRLAAKPRSKEELGEEFEIITIGPAGEKLVRFACISHDFGRQAGRTGVGAVLGSKNLKAIAVRGSRSLEAHDLRGLFQASKDMYAHIKSKPGFLGWTPEGTAGITDWCNQVGAFPTRNFSTSYAGHHKDINGKAVLEKVRLHDKGCFCCPTPCGKYGLAKCNLGSANMEGPEYETIALFGGVCQLKDIGEVAYANYLCDQLGLDTISAAVVAAWVMECQEKGLLSAEQVGMDTKFGDLASVKHLLELMTSREGLGDRLAEGVKAAAEWLGRGSMDFAIQVKGLEWTGYEARNAPGMMLSYMTADVGAHHNRSWALGNDVAGSQVDVHSLIAGGGEAEPLGKSPVGGQSDAVIHLQHLRPAFDLLGICRLQFMELGVDVAHYEKLFKLITGRELSWRQLLEVSEKVWQLTRTISMRELGGLERSWDYPPARFTAETIPSGPNTGHRISPDEVEKLLDEYYAARGWDQNGQPTPETLSKHGLDDVARELAGPGK
jgi:aldehyde:ferredoxin oxidoreductase